MKGIYLVTDAASCHHHSLETVVEKAVAAGVSCVQLREKAADTRRFLKKALALRQLLAPAGVPLIINDRLDIALAARADGVHIGQKDMPCGRARQILGPDAIIGLSVETRADVRAARLLDVDYLGVSPVFSTPTKTDTLAPWGVEGLAWVKANSRHRLVAIGGMGPDNAPEILRAGADAIAVVTAICSDQDPFRAARRLCRIYETHK